jgi:hypothetical protein
MRDYLFPQDRSPSRNAGKKPIVDGAVLPVDELAEIGRLSHSGDWGQASELALQCLERPETKAQPALRAAVCHNLAAILREAGEYEFAAGYQRLAQTFADLAKGRSVPAETSPEELSADAADRLSRGDLDGAEMRFAISLDAERRRGDIAGEASDWGNLFLVSLLRMDWRSAMFRWHRAWRLHQQMDDQRAVGVDLLNLAELALRLRKPRSARRLLDRAAIAFSFADAPALLDRALQKRDECRIPLAQVHLSSAVN